MLDCLDRYRRLQPATCYHHQQLEGQIMVCPCLLTFLLLGCWLLAPTVTKLPQELDMLRVDIVAAVGLPALG